MKFSLLSNFESQAKNIRDEEYCIILVFVRVLLNLKSSKQVSFFSLQKEEYRAFEA